MNYVATIGNREVKITVEEVGVARYMVRGDEKEYLVDAHQVQGSVWSILYGTTSFEGEEVQSDQGVIVVEAMKMENELKSAMAGKVKEIFVKEGEIVESGTKLLLGE